MPLPPPTLSPKELTTSALPSPVVSRSTRTPPRPPPTATRMSPFSRTTRWRAEPMDSATMSAQKPAGTVSPALSVAQTGLAACAVAELATANESVTASMGVRIGPIIYRDSASGACRLVTPCHHGRCSNRLRKAPHDHTRRLDPLDPGDALPRLPVVFGCRLTRAAGQGRALELPRRAQRVERAHPVLGLAAAQQPARDRARPRADSLDVGRVDHGERHAGDALGEDDVVRARRDDRLLVVGMRAALVGRDEARTELGAAARANDRHAEVFELCVQLLGAVRA